MFNRESMMSSSFQQKGKLNFSLFVVFALLLIIFRCIILSKFSFLHTDSDQTIMWNGLKNYSEGMFHEPRFYGQSYNTFLEAFFAIPLYKLGIPAYQALPIITTIFTLTPYFILALLLYFYKSPLLAIIVLSLSLLLPIEYALITSIPRGFVTGIFVASFGFGSLFNSKSTWIFTTTAFISVIAYSVNSNSVLVTVPCLLVLFFDNYSNKKFFIYSTFGFVVGIAIHYWVNHFYVGHPNYNLHAFTLEYNFSLLVSAFTKLDLFFNDVAPFFWKSGFLVVILFILLAFLLVQIKEKAYALVTLLIPFMIIATLGINKIHDGSNSVFFSYSRMFLAIPLILAIVVSFFKNVKFPNWCYIYLIIPCCYFIFHLQTADLKIKDNLDFKRNPVVCLIKIDRILLKCKSLSNFCKENKVDLIVISDHFYFDFYNYGCSSCEENFPNTIRPNYERRTWRLLEDSDKVYSTVLVIDISRNFASEFDFMEKVYRKRGYFMIRNNPKKTMKLLD